MILARQIYFTIFIKFTIEKWMSGQFLVLFISTNIEY